VSDCRSIKRAVPLAVYLKDKSTKLKVKGDCTVGMGSIPGLHNYESGGDSIAVMKQLRATGIDGGNNDVLIKLNNFRLFLFLIVNHGKINSVPWKEYLCFPHHREELHDTASSFVKKLVKWTFSKYFQMAVSQRITFYSYYS
jgi:hypothetical protein